MLVIHPAAEMLQPVANQQVINVKQQVVGRYLVEHFLRQGNGGSLVFYNHTRLSKLVVEDRIATQFLFPHTEFYLVA